MFFRVVNNSCACRWLARPSVLLALAGVLHLAMPGRTRAENRADYRYEDYSEDGGRIHVRTHAAYFNTELRPWLELQGNFVYDGISGATPLGAPPLPGSTTVPKAEISDIRRAGYLQPTFKLSNHAISPQGAYSVERDYESIGIALSDAIQFNEKNTTVHLGISHAFDRVLPNAGAAIAQPMRKDSTDALLGLSQLLGPNTVFTANLTLGYSSGYLSDPYKRVLFDDFPYYPGQPYTVFPESRPNHKFRQVAFLSLEHYVPAARGAIQGSYRFHHDDFGVLAHTVALQWNQKIGRRFIVSPLFRFHHQGAADFYASRFPGDPSCPPGADPSCPPVEIPRYYSSDYRLSQMDTFTYGIQVSGRIHEHISLDFGYKRYEMFGRDGRTAADQYPQAHVFTGGITIWF